MAHGAAPADFMISSGQKQPPERRGDGASPAALAPLYQSRETGEVVVLPDTEARRGAPPRTAAVASPFAKSWVHMFAGA